MQLLCLPAGQLFGYVLTGKFKSPSRDWRHAYSYLAEYELFVMTEGVLYLTYDHVDYAVKSGEYLLLPPREAFRKGYRPAGSSFYWLHFTTNPGDIPSEIDRESIFTPPPEKYFAIPQTGTIPRMERMVVLMKQLQDMVKSGYPAIALDAMSTSILTELYGQLSLKFTRESSPENQKQIYLDILDYIKTNITRPLKISEIAAHFGYNEKYLSHRFAEVFDIPLKQYILRVKIEQANFLLTDTNKSVSEIARELGFSDNHNFSRTYKRLTGLTPSEYRDTFSKRLLFHV